MHNRPGLQLEMDDQDIQTWRHLSTLTYNARHSLSPSSVNGVLRDHIKANPESPLASACLLWMGDNFLSEARFVQAIEAYQEVERYSKYGHNSDMWWSSTLEQIALCQERLGDSESAIETYKRILEEDERGLSEAWLHYRIGCLARRSERLDYALEAYHLAAEATDVPKHTRLSIADLARRELSQLESGQDWILKRPEEVLDILVYALREFDIAKLEQLASPTHFRIGVVGAELSFVPFEKILDLLKLDLSKAQILCDPSHVRDHRGKFYLITDGWRGELFIGRVVFVICRAGDGWEWNGIALTQPTEVLSELFDGQPLMTNQPLEIPIKAPWPAGTCFRAGGLLAFASEAVAALSNPLLSVGWSLGDCGWGPPGFYYNQRTHVGQDAFSVDFTRYEKGTPFDDAADKVAVLSIAEGVVSFVRSSSPNGDPYIDNQVCINHLGPDESWTDDMYSLDSSTRYQSKYLHLAGPNQIPVSRGMWVALGTQLGFMDDTGNSVLPHLHFSIHDRELGFQSVRPTPIDGYILDDNGSYQCIRSSNTLV